MYPVQKQNILKVTLFVLLTLLPILFTVFKISTLSNKEKKEILIKEKIGIFYNKLVNETSKIMTVANKENFSELAFYDQINNGDLIYIYVKPKIGVFINQKSNEIIGISSIK